MAAPRALDWRDRLRREGVWWLTNLAALIPLLWLGWDQLMGNLTVNPIDDYTDRTGSAAILLLLLALTVTPLHTLTGWRWLIPLRKPVGLYAFGYAALHLLVFVGLDYGFSLRFILLDGLPNKPYILVGLAAFLILLPLAITSTKGWMKRLGRRWKLLHRAVYAAGALAAIHYLWVAKVPFGEPTLYAALFTLVLAARIPPAREALSRLRARVGAEPQRGTLRYVPQGRRRRTG